MVLELITDQVLRDLIRQVQASGARLILTAVPSKYIWVTGDKANEGRQFAAQVKRWATEAKVDYIDLKSRLRSLHGATQTERSVALLREGHPHEPARPQVGIACDCCALAGLFSAQIAGTSSAQQRGQSCHKAASLPNTAESASLGLAEDRSRAHDHAVSSKRDSDKWMDLVLVLPVARPVPSLSLSDATDWG